MPSTGGLHRPTAPAAHRRALLLTAAAGVLGLSISLSSQPRAGDRPHVRIGGREAAAGEVLVKYRAVSPGRRAQIEVFAESEETEPVGRARLRRVRSRRLSTTELLRRLRAEPDVEYVEPNYVLYAFPTPNDPSFASLWGLFNTGFNTVGGGGTAGADIDAVSAWNVSIGSRTTVVAVIDTGIDYTHPDLSANVWSAPAPFTVTIAGQAITCQAGTHGFNAITRTCNPMDDATTPHGTHVSGTIGASGNNGLGVVGVNWVASLMGLKFMNQSGQALTSDAAHAIDFAVQAKAAFASSGGANVRVLNGSWGGSGYSQTLFDAITTAQANQMLFVAAAGNSTNNNDASPIYPSSFNIPNVVSVAASTNSDARASFSNYGATSVDLAAPGVGIVSTALGGGYLGLNGTSMAAPHVAGAAALVLSMCSATTSELRGLLLDTVDLVPALSSVTATGGRLNVSRAVYGCTRPLVTGVSLSANKVAPQGVGTSITFTATPTGGAAPHQYRWFVYDGTTWTPLTAWGSSQSYTWTPSTANASYLVRASVKSAWNTGLFESFDTMSFAVRPVVSAVSLSANKASPQGTGTSITFTASASGGVAPYQYRWFLHNGTVWTPLTNWGSSNTHTWTPTVANAAYQVRVAARSAWNTTSPENIATQAFVIRPVVTAVSLSANKTAPQGTGSSITFTAAASGGQAPYQYRWFVFDGTTWTGLTAWGSSNTYTWTPTVANTAYQIRAAARGSWNTGLFEAFGTVSYAIRPVVTGVTLGVNRTAPQSPGTSITFTASASGGVAPYQYRWFVFDGTTWTGMTAWGTSNTFTWTPGVANAAYQVRASARSAWNTGLFEAFATASFAIQ